MADSTWLGFKQLGKNSDAKFWKNMSGKYGNSFKELAKANYEFFKEVYLRNPSNSDMAAWFEPALRRGKENEAKRKEKEKSWRRYYTKLQ